MLRLFEEWLLSQFILNNEDQSDLSELFTPLKTVRKERQSPAHKIKENEYDKKYIDKQKQLISDLYLSIKSLRKIFQQHRKAKDVDIPNWLDENENIKIFLIYLNGMMCYYKSHNDKTMIRVVHL